MYIRAGVFILASLFVLTLCGTFTNRQTIAQQKQPPKQPPDAAKLLQKAEQTLEQSRLAMQQVKKTMERIEKLTPALESALKEYSTLAKESRKVVPEIEKTNKQIQALITTVSIGFLFLKKTNDQVQAAAQSWANVGKRVDSMLKKNEGRIDNTLAHLERVLGQTAKVMSDDNLKNTEALLRESAAAAAQLKVALSGGDKVLEQAQKTFRHMDETTSIAERAFKHLERATEPWSKRSPSVMKNLDEASSQLNEAIGDVRKMVGLIARSSGTVQKMLTDPTLYNRLDQAAFSINRLLPRVEMILRDMSIFADRLARHPEVIGLGGVVRPSSGLKTLPTRPVLPQDR